jgi:hypothetical protein
MYRRSSALARPFPKIKALAISNHQISRRALISPAFTKSSHFIMTQIQPDRLAPLKEAVAGLTSGNKLIAALEAAGNSSAAPVELITSVVIEAKSQKGNVAAAARVDLSNATSLISQMQFISPR